MTAPPTGIYYDPKYKDPCLSCHHRDQACANITNGTKYEDARMSKRIWMKHQEKKQEGSRQPDPKHCGHECNGQVCEKYNTLHFEGGQFDEPCSLGNICDYDTRTRGPVPADKPTSSESDPCLKCQIFLKGSHQCDGNPCGVKLDHSRKEHDTLIAARATAAENKRVLDRVLKDIDSIAEYGKMINENTILNKLQIITRDDYLMYFLKEEIESLRLAQPELKERDSE